MLRVLIVENQLLLGAGLQRLLSDETDLDVIGISPRNQLELVQEIRQLKPDVVFLDRDSRLIDATDLLSFLEDFLELRVVVINTNDHLAHIYNRRETQLCQATDLFDIIQERSSNDQTRKAP